MNEPPKHLRVPRHMRERPIGVSTRALAAIGLVIGLSSLASAIQNGLLVRGVFALLMIAVSGYWLRARNKAS